MNGETATPKRMGRPPKAKWPELPQKPTRLSSEAIARYRELRRESLKGGRPST